MKTALIVFVRHPELGKVKTRLASTIGDEAALTIYQRLLAHTLSIAKSSAADKFIFYAGELIEPDMWTAERFFKHKQADGDLGYRMREAFKTVFFAGYERVMIIGSDCYELTADIIGRGFQDLESKDIVIGPANDGGYYLLGMKQLHPQLFADKAWSTNTVFEETIKTMKELALTYNALPALNDVDEEKDLPPAWLNKA